MANLNLNGNHFTSFKDAILSLKTLPQLKSLYMNLYREDQVDLIMRTLPNLEFLNGLKVERDILDDDDHLQQNQIDEEWEEGNVSSPNHQQLKREQIVNIYTINSAGRQEDDDEDEDESSL